MPVRNINRSINHRRCRRRSQHPSLIRPAVPACPEEDAAWLPILRRPIPSSPLVGSDTSTAKLPAWLVLYRGYVVHSVNRQLEHRVTNIGDITDLNSDRCPGF